MLSLESGPLVVYGNPDPTQLRNPEQGPSLSFQGLGIVDPRFTQAIGAAPGSKIHGLYSEPNVPLLDGVPQTASATQIAAAANVVNGTAMTLTSTQAAGRSMAIPIVPLGSAYQAANVVTPAMALDFGFAIGGTTASSTAVTLASAALARFFPVGRRIVISGAGAAANTPLFTTVVSCTGTALVIADAAGQTVAAAQIGSANSSGIAAWPYVIAGSSGGVISLMDPVQMISRGLSVTGAAGGAGGNFLVSGYDVYGAPMSELITATAGATTAYGQKAFKYISSVVPQFTDAFNYSIGTSDLIGLPLRSDFWEHLEAFWNGAQLAASTGWQAATDTAPATTTTDDVRGFIQLGALGPLGSGATGGATNATRRIVVRMSVPLYNVLNATNQGYTSLFGQPQV